MGERLDLIVGCAAVAVSLGLLSFFVFHSRRTIERVARRNLKSAREIVRGLGE